MDLNVSDVLASQEAARSTTVRNATSKMELCLNDIEFSLNTVFKSKLDKLRCRVKNQKSLDDVHETMRQFQAYFSEVQAYSETESFSFKRQLGIILGDDYDRQLLCIENNLSASPNKSDKKKSICDKLEPFKDPQKVSAPVTSSAASSICGLDEEKSKSQEMGCYQPPKGNVNLLNSNESYDSSNDLPEARANALGITNQQTNSSQNTSDMNNFPNDSDPTVFSDDKPNGICPNSNSAEVPNIKPSSVSDVTPVENSHLETAQIDNNAGLQINTQISESLLRDSSPTFVETVKDNFNENGKTTDSEEKEAEELEAELVPKASEASLNNEGKTSRGNLLKTSKRRNEMDATSKKVNDWLNYSLRSDSLPIRSTSNDEEYQDPDFGIDDDGKTEIYELGPILETERVKDKSELIIDNNDNSSTSVNILSESVKPSDNENVSSKGEDVIEVSDEDFIGASLSSKRTDSPVTTFRKDSGQKENASSTPIKENRREDDNLIEVVELEELCDTQNEDVCLIETSQESRNSVKTETPSRYAHHISESSDNDAERLEGALKPNENLETSSISPNSLSDVCTQKVNPQEVDEAKRKLLVSSSSSSSDAPSQADGWDSDATFVIQKRKKFKKKRKKQSLNDSSNKSEATSLNDNTELNRLLNLGTLKKRRRVSESSDSSNENKSVAGLGDENLRKKKKKKLKKTEDLMDSPGICENSELETDAPDLCQNSPNIEAIKNNDGDIYREMLLASDSPGSSDNECVSSPEATKSSKTPVKRACKTNAEESETFLEDSGKKKKKRKNHDPLLRGKFSLSNSESEGEPDKQVSKECRLYDQKYRKLMEKKKKKEELRHITSSDEEKNSKSAGDQTANQENSDPINFVSCDPECVEISEDDSEDDRTTIGFHQISSSSSEDEDIQCIPQSQETNTSNKSGRKNIRKVISLEEMTAESKRAAKEEEERRKRISEKELLFSQTFTDPEVGKLILDIDKDTKQELVTVHPGLMAVLKKHQIEGVKFMWNTCFETLTQVKTTSGSGCVLAHCMGLGKSLQVVTLVHTIINHPDLNLRTILIVCPKSVVLNWGDEFKKWLKNVYAMDKSSKKVEIFDLSGMTEIPLRERGLEDWQKKGGVMIMSYHGFRALVTPSNIPEKLQGIFDNIRKHLVDPGPDIVVFDEGHLLKNNSSNMNIAANQLRTKRRIVLTGTPMQNNLMEYYYMVNLVKPNLLGDKKEFSNRFFNPINNGQFQDSTPHDVKIMKSRAHVLYKKLDGIVQRFDSNIFENHLPERYEYVLKLRLSELQIKLYKTYLDGIQKSSDETQEIEQTRILMKSEKVLALICSHPKIFENTNLPKSSTGPGDATPFEKTLNAEADLKKCLEGINVDDINLSSKTVLFFEILKKCAESGDKLLVFSQHLKTLDLLEFFLKKANKGNTDFFQPNSAREMWIPGKDYFRLDGRTEQSDRKKYCQIFNSDNKRARLFLLSTKAGGLGLNLTGANRAIVFDVSWNPSVDSQSVFRIYRFGQSKPCYIYRFVMKGTMEEKKYHRQVSKLSTSSRVIDKRQVGRHYQEKYLRTLFEYDFNYNQNQPRPKRPQDKVLSELLLHVDCIDAYEEHDILLMNIQDEELTEEDRQKAWDDYEKEKRSADFPAPNSNPPPQKLNNSVSMNQWQQRQFENYVKAYNQYIRKPEGLPPKLPVFMRKRVEKEPEYQFLIKCSEQKKIPLPYHPLGSQVPSNTASDIAAKSGTSSSMACESEKLRQPLETASNQMSPEECLNYLQFLKSTTSTPAENGKKSHLPAESAGIQMNPNQISHPNIFIQTSKKTPAPSSNHFTKTNENFNLSSRISNLERSIPVQQPPSRPPPQPADTSSIDSKKISEPALSTKNHINQKKNVSEQAFQRIPSSQLPSQVSINGEKIGLAAVSTNKQTTEKFSQNISSRLSPSTFVSISKLAEELCKPATNANTQMNPQKNIIQNSKSTNEHVKKNIDQSTLKKPSTSASGITTKVGKELGQPASSANARVNPNENIGQNSKRTSEQIKKNFDQSLFRRTLASASGVATKPDTKLGQSAVNLNTASIYQNSQNATTAIPAGALISKIREKFNQPAVSERSQTNHKKNSTVDSWNKIVHAPVPKSVSTNSQQSGEGSSSKKTCGSDTKHLTQPEKPLKAYIQKPNLLADVGASTKPANLMQNSGTNRTVNNIPCPDATTSNESESTAGKPSSLNNIIEEIKSYVRAKVNGESN